MSFCLHFPAAGEDEQQLVQLAKRMRADTPIVEAAAIRNRLDLHKALVRVPGRLAVQKKSRYCAPGLRHRHEMPPLVQEEGVSVHGSDGTPDLQFSAQLARGRSCSACVPRLP